MGISSRVARILAPMFVEFEAADIMTDLECEARKLAMEAGYKASYHYWWDGGATAGDASPEDILADAEGFHIHGKDAAGTIALTIQSYQRWIDEKLIELAFVLIETLEPEQLQEMYVVLTCTAHGRPVWRATEDPDGVSIDRDVHNPPPVRTLGPYGVGGRHGYPNVKEAVANDPEKTVDLENPETWFNDPGWLDNYMADEPR